VRKETKMRKINDTKKTYEISKPWSLLVGLNGFTYELIGPQINNVLLINLGPNNKPRNAQISHY
jgi:hypothetical protein